MADAIHFHSENNIDLNKVLKEGPSLEERATRVALSSLGKNAVNAEKERFLLNNSWTNLKLSLAGRSIRGTMNLIEKNLGDTIELKHFQTLAAELKKSGFNIDEKSLETLPVGIHTYASLCEDQATETLYQALGKQIALPNLTSLAEKKAWLDDPANAPILNTVETLDLSNCWNTLKVVPSRLAKLTQLKKLDLSFNELPDFPEWLPTHLTKLESLKLDNTGLTLIPSAVCNLPRLTHLDLGNNKISHIPAEIGKLKSLVALNLCDNQITEIPEEIGNLTQLTTLHLFLNKITEIPKEIGKLGKLKILDLSSNQITEIPEEIRTLKSLSELFLFENKISKIPKVLWALDIKKLSLYSNQITEIGPECAWCTKLENLDLRHNRLTKLPNEICSLPNLHMLSLTSNQLEEVPALIGQHVQELFLANNNLSVLPQCWHTPRRLTILDLSYNLIDNIPSDLAREGTIGQLTYRL